eukprot:NODE_195_length_13287_cov_0.482484.p13 type:complete len:102 gc:universal NODE_195_length_13287_cov_0.482484:3255-3560(+)
MSGHALMITTSPNFTLRFLLIIRFILIFPSGVSSSTNAIKTVSFLLLPFNITVSPLKRPSVSIALLFKQQIELSSLVASSTTNLFGAGLDFKIFKAGSFSL